MQFNFNKSRMYTNHMVLDESTRYKLLLYGQKVVSSNEKQPKKAKNKKREPNQFCMPVINFQTFIEKQSI